MNLNKLWRLYPKFEGLYLKNSLEYSGPIFRLCALRLVDGSESSLRPILKNWSFDPTKGEGHLNCLDVAAFIRDVNPHKATGPDGIPPLILLKFSHVLTFSTTFLVNESLSRATVPQAFKQAAVCPIFKKGEVNVSSNYRPVRLLFSLSTILERVVLCQLQNFTSQSDPPILPPEQFAYRHGHSCEDLLTKNIIDWHVALDAGKVVGVVMLDMSKAFDCVNYELLLLELQLCGTEEQHWAGLSAIYMAGFHVYKLLTHHLTRNLRLPVASHRAPSSDHSYFLLYIRTLSSVLRNSLLSQYVDITLYVAHRDTEFVADALIFNF